MEELGLGKDFPDYAQKQQAIEMLKSGQPVGPRTYEVNINADPSQFLDWDKPLGAQGQVGEAFRSAVPDPGWWSRQIEGLDLIRRERAKNPENTGASAYSAFGRLLGSGGEAKASAALNEAGIPGIKYLDEGSRFARPLLKTSPAGDVISSHYPAPTSNYVVFNPSIIDIMKKYGLAGAAPLGMGALAAQDAYQQQGEQ
jgi:hypothetical protein